MRLWTLHPRYLDAKGLVALWREALLAQAVVLGRTKGYRHHPQLRRFLATADPPAAVASYLAAVQAEAVARGYKFDAGKIGAARLTGTLPETRGQLRHEWMHLRLKLRDREPARWRATAGVKRPRAHPMFRLVAGGVRDWEKRRTANARWRGRRPGAIGNDPSVPGCGPGARSGSDRRRRPRLQLAGD
jgi:hypothetical protein